MDSEEQFERAGHRTKLIVKVERHLPNPDSIRDILSARFLHDPQFVVRVNGASIALPEHTGLVDKARLEISPGKSIEAFVVDTTPRREVDALSRRRILGQRAPCRHPKLDCRQLGRLGRARPFRQALNDRSAARVRMDRRH